MYFGEDEVKGSPLQLRVHDPQKAWLSGPEDGFVGELLIYKGRNKCLTIPNVFNQSILFHWFWLNYTHCISNTN